MEWYNSDEFGPKHSSQIFVWDARANKEIYIHFLGEWEFGASNSSSFCRNFPIWRYVHDGIDPIPRNQPERSKREDLHHKDCIPWIKHDCWHGYDRRHLCKYKEDCDNIVGARMRCSEHCGNTVRDK